MLAGIAALSLAACGSSTTTGASVTAASGAPSTSTTPAPAAKARVAGLITSVSGGTVTVNGPKGPTTVDVTPSTRVTRTTPGQLAGVTVGECVVARPAKNGGTPPTITAASVAYGTAENAQCSHPGTTTDHRAVVGTVASVDANTIAVTSTNAAAGSVTVTPTTRYMARSDATPSVIAVGQCLTARGTSDASGLQAQDVAVRPSRNGRCGR
ncbi:DUF5666 domain-containing protein [Mycobacterium yunnanensis]|uniref:DUF5666 domain-containing protein n=1 Tax=Mycobacterium yunnanensis TaxID=368477 RepID=UPI0021F33BAC|nr:DUF5666 domain-containing protein [Mycobacterium yunnanensis]